MIAALLLDRFEMLHLPKLPLAEASHSRNVPEFDEASLHLLNRLRLCAMQCRVAARADLFEACALLTLDGEDAKITFNTTFVKCLPDAARAPIKWYQPGASEITFDEAWVLRCLASIRKDDTSSLAFLLRSRITPSDQRYIGFLLGRISEQNTQN